MLIKTKRLWERGENIRLWCSIFFCCVDFGFFNLFDQTSYFFCILG